LNPRLLDDFERRFDGRCLFMREVDAELLERIV
jgi:hypothetical protein